MAQQCSDPALTLLLNQKTQRNYCLHTNAFGRSFAILHLYQGTVAVWTGTHEVKALVAFFG